MNLGELIYQLREKGDNFISWSGVETNVESVGEPMLSYGKWRIELKLKEEQG